MRRASPMVTWLLLPALAVVGSTITVRPILGAEPSEELKAIRELLTKMDQRLETQNTIALQLLDKFSLMKSEMNGLRDELAKVQREMNDLRGRSGGTSTSYFGGSAPAAATASFKLVNTYVSDMTAMINGTMVIVPPGQTRVVPVMPGTSNYQVYQTQDWARSTILRPGEVLTLSLYPLQ